jgi:hypothetical protein
LHLFALDDDETAPFARLEQEEAIAYFTAHAYHHPIGILKDVIHEGVSSLSDAVLLTVSTTGPPLEKPMALTEHVEMTVR